MGEICKYASRAQRAVVYFLVSELIFKRCQGRYFLLTLPSWTRRGVSFTVIIQVVFLFFLSSLHEAELFVCEKRSHHSGFRSLMN